MEGKTTMPTSLTISSSWSRAIMNWQQFSCCIICRRWGACCSMADQAGNDTYISGKNVNKSNMSLRKGCENNLCNKKQQKSKTIELIKNSRESIINKLQADHNYLGISHCIKIFMMIFATEIKYDGGSCRRTVWV